jgi:FtsZ-binding cell division protein ZapB
MQIFTPLERLGHLEAKLRSLVHAYQHLAQENEALKAENLSLQATVASCRAELENLAQQPPQSPLWGEGAEQDDLKQLVDQYIKKIDNCIVQLNQQL